MLPKKYEMKHADPDLLFELRTRTMKTQEVAADVGRSGVPSMIDYHDLLGEAAYHMLHAIETHDGITESQLDAHLDGMTEWFDDRHESVHVDTGPAQSSKPIPIPDEFFGFPRYLRGLGELTTIELFRLAEVQSRLLWLLSKHFIHSATDNPYEYWETVRDANDAVSDQLDLRGIDPTDHLPAWSDRVRIR